MKTVQCCTHGTQQATWVCQHILSGLIENTPVGFFWTTWQPDNPRPDAWCAECEVRSEAHGGEWTGEAEEHLQPKLLCGACYDSAKRFHMGEAL